MTTSHDFDLTATPEMKALLALVQARGMEAPADAAATQPVFERALREHMLALERRVHTFDFRRFDVDVPGVVVEGVRFRRREAKTVGEYTTLAGKIHVERTTYRARGGNGRESVVPLDLRLGLVDGHWTLAAAEAGCAFMAAVPSKEAAGLLKAAGTMQPSSSHLDRLPKRVSEVWEKRRKDFEAEVRAAEALDLPSPENVALIVPSLDGIMLQMKDAPRMPGLGKRDQGPKGHREVGCGTVSLYDVHGERLHTVKFARMPERHKVRLHQQLVDEVRAMLERYPHAEVVAVADGAAENWRILGEVAETLGCRILEVLDFYHAVEHLEEAMRAIGASDIERARLRNTLRDAPDGVERVIEELAVTYSEVTVGRLAVGKALAYFENNSHRADYADRAAAHQPIGSGVQEAACKSLVGDRMKRSGMSWLETGGQAILTVRGLAQSGRLRHAWDVLAPVMRREFQIDPDMRRKSPRKAA